MIEGHTGDGQCKSCYCLCLSMSLFPVSAPLFIPPFLSRWKEGTWSCGWRTFRRRLPLSLSLFIPHFCLDGRRGHGAVVEVHKDGDYHCLCLSLSLILCPDGRRGHGAVVGGHSGGGHHCNQAHR